MTEQSAKRSRGVFKGLWLSEAEWARVQRRMEMAGINSFSAYARQALTESRIAVTRVAFDPAPLRVELSRIGNNINQIARHVNVDGEVTVEQMRATRELLKQIQRTIDAAAGAEVE
ncbi:MobC family plasmid mobilization relaxosome protein [Actinomyces sp. 594]|uniref:MobC family plasmid mobilization relaxosome protein n=1 Tax=Actinomyces sp. 594 TaxID=2057793 RepID=UPI001C58B736|nr:MobC family plasmid mobilization relaxosome protein [Actinomyces sp. 594]MBW3069626.1 MobC family plasmid mobilization relaxosome protein [Actinomyces sp. 594]